MSDPRTRLLLLGCASILAVVLERPVSLGLLAAAGLVAFAFATRGRWWGRALVAVVLVVWSTVLSQALFYADLPRTAWFRLGPLVFWREGVRYGLVQSLRLVGVTLGGLAVAVSTPPDRLLAGLRALRVPFGLALMAATAVRFLPEVGRTWWLVRRARARRGRPTWRRVPWRMLAVEVAMLRPVVAHALRRARALAESLDARGFDPEAPRSALRPLHMPRRELLLLGAAFAATGAAAAGRLALLLYASDTLYVPAWRPLYAWVRAWL